MAQFTLPINSIVKKGKTFESKLLPKNQLCVEVYRYDPELKSNPRVDTYILDKDKFGQIIYSFSLICAILYGGYP